MISMNCNTGRFLCVSLNAFAIMLLATLTLYAANPVKSNIVSLDGEKWWGAVLMDGHLQPFENYPVFDLSNECHDGQTVPFLISSKGRYVWGDRPFRFSFSDGNLIIESDVPLSPVKAGETLRDAYLAASACHFPFDGTFPPEEMFIKPQFNNWIESAVFGINQVNAEAYIQGIADNAFPCGVVMIDGGWMVQHGTFKFNPETFPDPGAMFAKIHALGYKGMIWTSYFMSADSRDAYLDYRLQYPRKKPLLVESTEYPGEECIVHWWSGKSVSFDLTNPEAFEEYAGILEDFRNEYGIDGFKFDGGNPEYFRGKAKFFKPDDRACDFAHAYNLLGLRFPYNEFRAGYKMGGYPVVVRLQDIPHSWEALSEALYDVQLAGLMGLPYVIADMIGGGLAASYVPGAEFSSKLLVRSCQLQALMPMMQFSVAPWRVLSEKECEICRKFAKLHERFGPYILALVKHASETGEPIVRMMEYEFPGQGFDRRMSQFMLGPDYIVAPVITEDDCVTVELPKGRWQDDEGRVFRGPRKLELKNVPLGRLPYFKRTKK